MNTTLAALLMVLTFSAQAATLTETLTDPASKAVFAGSMKSTQNIQNTQTVQGDQIGKETDDQYKARVKTFGENYGIRGYSNSRSG